MNEKIFPQGKMATIQGREFFIDRSGNYTQQCTSDETTFCIGESKCIFCDRNILKTHEVNGLEKSNEVDVY
jgi:hypothetical protein